MQQVHVSLPAVRVALAARPRLLFISRGVWLCVCAGSHVNWMEASLEQLSAPLPPWAIRAGAREKIYHDPRNTTAAIVTCGGLCPGLNDVVAVSKRILCACVLLVRRDRPMLHVLRPLELCAGAACSHLQGRSAYFTSHSSSHYVCCDWLHMCAGSGE
jgi:hypothetical protein